MKRTISPPSWSTRRPTDKPLINMAPGGRGRITRIVPESVPLLPIVQELGLLPETKVHVIRQEKDETVVKVEACNICVLEHIGQAVWIEVEE